MCSDNAVSSLRPTSARTPSLREREAGRSGHSDDSATRAWLDDDGGIMVLATHNTDIGDGWEREAYRQWFFEKFSTRYYMIGANVITYAMTH
jgi:hypothetical protein